MGCGVCTNGVLGLEGRNRWAPGEYCLGCLWEVQEAVDELGSNGYLVGSKALSWAKSQHLCWEL